MVKPVNSRARCNLVTFLMYTVCTTKGDNVTQEEGGGGGTGAYGIVQETDFRFHSRLPDVLLKVFSFVFHNWLPTQF